MLLVQVDCLEGETIFSIMCHCLHQIQLVVTLMRDVVGGLRGLLPAKRPEGGQVGLAKDTLVVLNNFFSRPRYEEVNFDLSTQGDIAENIIAIWLLSNNGELGISIAEVHTDILLSLTATNQQEGVHTILATTATGIIEVCLICDSICPHAPGALSEFKGSKALSKPIDLVGWNQEVHLDVLV